VSREIVVTGLCRTPIGTFGGALKDIKCVLNKYEKLTTSREVEGMTISMS
jgi:hypothetical protein